MKAKAKTALNKLEPMEAKSVPSLPTERRWQFEPKWDGFRCLVFRHGSEVILQAKSGKPLTRYFPEIAAAFAALKPRRFVLDGELLIPVGNKTWGWAWVRVACRSESIRAAAKP